MKSILGALALTTALSASPALAESNKVIQRTHDDIIKVCNDPDFGKYIINSKDSICDEYSTDGGKTWIKEIGGASILATIGLSVLYRRKKEKKEIADGELNESDFDFSIPPEESDGDSIPPEIEMDLLENDFTSTDYLNEAGVWMAYGRYTEAEEMLGKVLQETPESIEAYTMLLRLYFETKNPKKFHEAFMHDEMVHVRNNISGEDLIQVKVWGREIDPNNPMYIEDEPREVAKLGKTIVVKPEKIAPKTEEITPHVDEIVISHNEVNPGQVTESENIFPTQIKEPEKISTKAKMMPGLQDALEIQLTRRGFEVVKKPDLGEIHIKAIREGSELHALNERGEVIGVTGQNQTYIIDSSVLNAFLKPDPKKPSIRLERGNKKTIYIEIAGKFIMN